MYAQSGNAAEHENIYELLTYAISRGLNSPKVLRAIIDLDSSILLKEDSYGDIPFVMALKTGLNKDAQLSLVPPSFVQKKDGDSDTLLHLAIHYDSSDEVLLALCTNVSDMKIQNKRGQSPLLHAVIKHRSRAVIEILANEETNVPDNDGNVSISVVCNTWNATREDFFDVLKILVKTYCAPDIRDPNGTPLHSLLSLPGLNIGNPKLCETIDSIIPLIKDANNRKVNRKLPVTIAIESGASHEVLAKLLPTRTDFIEEISKIESIHQVVYAKIPPATLKYLFGLVPYHEEEVSIFDKLLAVGCKNPELFKICANQEPDYFKNIPASKTPLVAFLKNSANAKVFESKHPYDNNTKDDHAFLHVQGAVGFTITFHPETSTETDYDYIRFYTDKERTNQVGLEYSGGRNDSRKKFPVIKENFLIVLLSLAF